MIRTMPRTSTTHPLHIAELSPGPGMGRIGITLCPCLLYTSDAADE